jgi:hypothetical protein
MNRDPQVPNRKLALSTIEQVDVLVSRLQCLAEAKQLTLMKIDLQTPKVCSEFSTNYATS